MSHSHSTRGTLKNWQSERLQEEPVAKAASQIDIFRDACAIIRALAAGDLKKISKTDGTPDTVGLNTGNITPHCRTKADLSLAGKAVANVLRDYALDHDFKIDIEIARAPKAIAEQNWQPIQSFALNLIMTDQAEAIGARSRIKENLDAMLEGLKSQCRIPDAQASARTH